jgi:chloramphenicol 3-O-phosphotransferase
VHLVFLHGPPAAGKLAVARALESRVRFPVFHNHLVVDLLTTVFPFGSEPFVRLREELWTSVLADAARTGVSLTFTFAPDVTVEPGFPDRVLRLVESRGGLVHFVRLRVSPEEQERRIGSPARAEFHKLTSVDTLRRLRARREGVEQPPVELDVDTDTTAPAEAAAAIADRFGLVAQPPVERYPET